MIPYFSQKVYNEFAGNEKAKGGDYKNHTNHKSRFLKNNILVE